MQDVENQLEDDWLAAARRWDSRVDDWN